MEIQELMSFDFAIQELINNFLTQLTGHNKKINSNHIEEIISDNNSHLFFEIND